MMMKFRQSVRSAWRLQPGRLMLLVSLTIAMLCTVSGVGRPHNMHQTLVANWSKALEPRVVRVTATPFVTTPAVAIPTRQPWPTLTAIPPAQVKNTARFDGATAASEQQETEQGLAIRRLSNGQPTPTPPSEQTITVQVYLDSNGNDQFDRGEGVTDLPVYLLTKGTVVGWGVTNGRGQMQLWVVGEIEEISIPFLSGWRVRVEDRTRENQITIQIPGGGGKT